MNSHPITTVFTPFFLLILSFAPMVVTSGGSAEQEQAFTAARQYMVHDVQQSCGQPVESDFTVYLPVITRSDGSQADRDQMASSSTPIEITVGEVISDEISLDDPCKIYHFEGAAGQTLFFDVQEVDHNQLNWLLNEPDGTTVIDTCLACNPVVQTLTHNGSYTLTLSGGAGAYQFQLWDVPEPQIFNVQLGEIISDIHPGSGSGRIESPVAADVYAFAASAGDAIFFDVQGITNTQSIKWSLQDSLANILFDDCLACGDKGPFDITTNGVYTLTVGQTAVGAYGTYQIQIVDASGPDQFAIEIGDVVSLNDPGPGAGQIETAGAVDIYTFDAAAGETVFFDMQIITGTGALSWSLEDALGMTLFDKCLACGDPGAIDLTAGGEYTLTVGSESVDAVGTYQFQTTPVVTSEQFEIMIDDVVAENTPAVGAGRIESPGVLDIYTFPAAAGERIFVDLQALSAGLAIHWKLEDPQGTTLFRDCIACGDPGRLTLTEGGVYTLTVGTQTSSAVGTYQFQLWSVPPPDQFAIAIGDVVSIDNPGVGAGHIESPGAEDEYTFSATAGQIVTFDMQQINGTGGLRWTLKDAVGGIVFQECLACGDINDLELSAGGTYTLTVGRINVDATGSYQFQLVAP